MQISIVVAASENNVIGVNNALPWHLPDDLKFFKKNTLGKPVIMGKNTWLSIGRALPGRLNIILSASLDQQLPQGVLRLKNIQDAYNFLSSENTEEACIIGGEQLYESALPATNTIYLTRVHTHIDKGTAFFPDVDWKDWILSWEETHPVDERHAFPFTFQRWERKPAHV